MSKPKVEKLGRGSDEDALRLTVAFYCIMEADRRVEVLALAESLATKSQRIFGIEHFADLDANKNNGAARAKTS